MPEPQSTNGPTQFPFQYPVPDQYTGGTWLIYSQRELKKDEIVTHLRFIVSCGLPRPEKGRITVCQWPLGQ
jgi:hypothetical protein